MEHTSASTKTDEPYSLHPASVYSLAGIFANVNTADGQLLKYIPDEFLKKGQIEAKIAAKRKTDEYIREKNERRAPKNDVERSVSQPETAEDRWTATRAGSADKTPMPRRPPFV